MKPYNRHVHMAAATMSVLLALAGILNHGIFEIRQGFNPTNGLFIEAISESDRFWFYGTEAAFTIIPNFLLTGLMVTVVGVGLIIFSLKYLALAWGSRILLAFFVLLTLFGGGIGHLVVSLPTWAFATRIHAPLNLVEKYIPKRIRQSAARLWLLFLLAACCSWITVMQLGIFGYVPGVDDPDTILNVVFLFLLATTLLLSLAFICAMAKDLSGRE